MEQIQRLAKTIAEVYLRDLKKETGGDTVTINGITKHISLDELTFGLVGVVSYNAKKHEGERSVLSDPYKNLMEMICIGTKPYTLTGYGVRLINYMNEISINKSMDNEKIM
ncbi:hypothetical protein [Serratia marcescens]|uniref:hypothetical protein n=1 Tax=Serratia marcescens TaxID=615 RepID=UPI00102238FF|nr:hypothetical protein [Serratia marcescens]RZF13786.1 hypothetical protein B7L62_18465 [Serratia marcescens]